MFDISVDDKIVEEHYEKVKAQCESIIRKLKGKKFKKNQVDFKYISNADLEAANKKFIEFLKWIEKEENIKKIITGKPKELLDIYNDIVDKFSFNICKFHKDKKGKYVYEFYEDENGKNIYEFHQVFGEYGIRGETVLKEIEKIFNYIWFRDKYAYELTDKMKVNICPYCNREFVFTVIDEDGKNIIRPELDHYFPQSKYPMYSLSIYNLIPSGHICNSNIKGKNNLNLNDHLHPYIIENKEFSFVMDMKNGQIKDTEIQITSEHPKVNNTIDFFKLRQIYKCHKDVSDDIKKIYDTYKPQKIIDYVNYLKGFENQNITKNDVLETIYHKYIVENEDCEILGKLRKDLYKEIYEVYAKYFNDNEKKMPSSDGVDE